MLEDEVTSKRLDDLKSKSENLKRKIGAIRNIGEKNLKPLKEALEKAEKDLENEAKPFEAEVEKIDSQIWAEKISLMKGDCLSRLLLGVETKQNFMDWFRAFINPFKKFEKTVYGGSKVVGVKKLKNGLVSARIANGDISSIFILEGLRLVGYHYTEKSKHPGDSSYRYAWLGVKDLNDKTEIDWKRMNGLQDLNPGSSNSPITQDIFLGIVEDQKNPFATNLPSIEFSKENLEELQKD